MQRGAGGGCASAQGQGGGPAGRAASCECPRGGAPLPLRRTVGEEAFHQEDARLLVQRRELVGRARRAAGGQAGVGGALLLLGRHGVRRQLGGRLEQQVLQLLEACLRGSNRVFAFVGERVSGRGGKEVEGRSFQ